MEGGSIYTTEHLFAAIAGFQITDLQIEVEGEGHIPFFDGSSFEFACAIQEVGLIDMPTNCPIFTITHGSVIHSGRSVATLLPSLDGMLRIDAHISFPAPIGEQWFSYVNHPLAFCLAIAQARTFMGRPWLGESLKHVPGFYHRGGSSRETNMLTHNGSVFNVDLRMSNEPVRHKVLDALGDLAILGRPLVGHIRLFRPGHFLNRAIIGAIASQSQYEEAICA
jgi:UDP-3-O-[3-hydroxymyristoyl] N-acetylglucosamine deacetylase